MKSSVSIIISTLFFILVMLFIYGVNYTSTTFVESIKDLGAISIEFGNFGIIFEVMAILLLSSMFGAFYLASKEEDQ
ncbi:MAG: hypothetical protein ACP5SF_03295 [Thermoplasmata archaeon]